MPRYARTVGKNVSRVIRLQGPVPISTKWICPFHERTVSLQPECSKRRKSIGARSSSAFSESRCILAAHEPRDVSNEHGEAGRAKAPATRDRRRVRRPLPRYPRPRFQRRIMNSTRIKHSNTLTSLLLITSILLTGCLAIKPVPTTLFIDGHNVVLEKLLKYHPAGSTTEIIVPDGFVTDFA